MSIRGSQSRDGADEELWGGGHGTRGLRRWRGGLRKWGSLGDWRGVGKGVGLRDDSVESGVISAPSS